MSVNILIKRSDTPSKRPDPNVLLEGELALNFDAATGGLYYKDTDDNVVKIGPCQISTTAPNSTPAGSSGNSPGELWFNTAANGLFIWNGTSWVDVTTGIAVQAISGSSPITVDNTDPTNPVIGIDASSTTQSGAVQLNDTVTSTSTTQAATANAVKTAYDQAAGAIPESTFTTAGELIVGTGAGTYTVLAPGAAEYVLQSNGNGTLSWVVNSAGDVTGVNATFPITVDNTDPQQPTIGINGASTSAAGAVQLNDTVTSTSVLEAATANAVKTAYDAALSSVQTVSGTSPIQVDNADPQNLVVSADAATTSALGVVQVGTNIDVTAGTISVPAATAAAQGAVQVGTNIDVAAGTISVANSSTTAKGVVQLNDTTNNSSTDLALTAAQGKNLQDQIDALVITSNLTFAGTFDTTVGPNGVMATVSAAAAGLAVPFVVGNPLPAPSAGNAEFFVIVTGTVGVYGPTTVPASAPPYHLGDWFLSDGTNWEFLNVGFQYPAATTTVEGVVYLATDLEVQAGTDTSNKAVNPASLQAKVSDSTSTTDSFAIASSTAVKSAYDLANDALPKSGGTMTGAITAAAAGVIFSDASTVDAISDSTSTNSSTTAASSTAVKSAYDLAAAAMPLAGGTFTGDVTVSGGLNNAGIGSTGTIVPGVGYTIGTYTNVPLTGGGGSGATADIEVTAGPAGRVTAVSIIDSGTNYGSESGSINDVATVTITGTGSGLRVGYQWFEGSLVDIDSINNPGSGYAIGDTVYVGVGKDGVVEITALDTGGIVTGVSIVSPGSGYIVGPTVTGSIPGGSGWQVPITSVLPPSTLFTLDSSTEVNGPITFGTTPTFYQEIGPSVQVTYDNVFTGLSSTNVQDAIDELDALIISSGGSGLPLAGGTMTGNIVLSSGVTIDYADTTAGSVAAADQLATVVDNSDGNLTIVPGFDAGTY